VLIQEGIKTFVPRKEMFRTNDKRHTKTYNKINSSVGGNKKLEGS